MRQRWETVTFLHWPYPPVLVERLLPRGLDLETWDGQAWVSLVLLRMKVMLPTGPPSLLAPPFPETNVRTYVKGPGGATGILFFSLDAASKRAVAAARAAYGLPYFWAEMGIRASGDLVRYRSRRRFPGPAGAGHEVEVVAGRDFDAHELTERDHYLTARFALWNGVSRLGRSAALVSRAQAAHRPWPLRRAEVRELHQDLLQAAGLPEPAGPPLAHFSDGVDVAISAPGLRAVKVNHQGRLSGRT